MQYETLFNRILAKRSFLCVGLDSDITKLPEHLLESEDPQFAFNREIIDATAPYCVAYKPNVAFYEAQGMKGWLSLEKSVAYIRQRYPEIFVIADAKRGDIGNTSALYARAFFSEMNCDAVTVAPYMGEDSVTPFLTYPERWVILLALTSNKGALDFQMTTDAEGTPLFEKILATSKGWGTPDNMMYVVGATQAEKLSEIRRIVPEHFLLIPGVGAQGGSLEKVARYGMNSHCGLLVNASRSIIFASHNEDFAADAAAEAKRLAGEMDRLLTDFLK